jgi:phage-related protein
MDEPDRKIIPVAFYRTKVGNEPVREWLMEMTAADKKVIGSHLQTVEYGWPVGMPVCRPMGNGLFEVRSDIRTASPACCSASTMAEWFFCTAL